MKEKIKEIVDTIGEIIKWFVGLCFFAGVLTFLVYIGDKVKGGSSFVAWGGWGKVFLKALVALVAIPIIFVLVVTIIVFVIGSFTSFGRKEKGGNAHDDSSDDGSSYGSMG